MLNKIRWIIFVQLSNFGWKVCPEPQRTYLKRGVGTWDEVNERANATFRDHPQTTVATNLETRANDREYWEGRN